MKIAFFGDGKWAHKALTRIIEHGYEVSLVVVRFESKDPFLIEIANYNNIPVCWHQNVNLAEFIEVLKKNKADLGVSMSFNQIIKKQLIDFYPKGFINCHAGKLPFYRGRNILNWALINDEKEIGVTCHYIDEGIDTGDIIIQKTFEVTEEDDYKTVLEKAIQLCPEVLIESIHAIASGNNWRIKQSKEGSYFPMRVEGDEYINWEWPSRRIFNFVRAITFPGPYARTWLFHSKKKEYIEVLIKKVQLKENSIEYICTPGAILGKNENNYLIKTGNSFIELIEYEILNTEIKKLKVGDHLGINVHLLFKSNSIR